MNGWCKFVEENDNGAIIEYSLGADNRCTGKLKWDKDTQQITILRLATNATATLTDHFICVVRSRIRRGFELNRLYYLAV